MDRTLKKPAHRDARAVERRHGVNTASFYGDDAASVAWRSQQAHVDADIEGLARDPVAETLVADWTKSGLSFEEQRSRLRAHYRSKESASTLAAE